MPNCLLLPPFRLIELDSARNAVLLQLRDLSVGFVKRDRTKADIKEVPWYALNVPRALRKSLIIEGRK